MHATDRGARQPPRAARPAPQKLNGSGDMTAHVPLNTRVVDLDTPLFSGKVRARCGGGCRTAQRAQHRAAQAAHAVQLAASRHSAAQRARSQAAPQAACAVRASLSTPRTATSPASAHCSAAPHASLVLSAHSLPLYLHRSPPQVLLSVRGVPSSGAASGAGGPLSCSRRTFHIAVQGRFKRELLASDLQTGQEFPKAPRNPT